MLFFYNFKLGKYGQFYGSVSPMTILSSLRSFVRERNDELFQHESELREKEREYSRKNTISAEEFFGEKAQSVITYFQTFIDVLRSLTLK